MIKISPSILASDFSKLGEEIKKVEDAGADYIHIDVMDGHFVPNISIGIPVVKSLKKCASIPLDVHLMIENPDKYIDEFVEAGADILTVHAEACNHLDRTISYIKSKGIKAGVSLNPATPICTIQWVLDKVDLVLLMTVNPGFGGQAFIQSVVPKIRELSELIGKRKLDVDIEVDGGICKDNIKEVTKAGANIIVAGSSIYKSPDVKEAIRQMRENAE